MEEAPSRHISRRNAARASCVLPEDAFYEILLRLPAEDACRRWRSLLSGPHFIAAHAARHPEPPLVVVGYAATEQNGRVLFDIVDLSGRVVKRVHAAGDDGDGLKKTKWWVMSTHGDLLCFAKGCVMSFQLLNLTTGAVHGLPDGLAAEHAAHVQDLSDCRASVVFGLVPSTGEYKIHRIIEDLSKGCDYPTTKLYEVLLLMAALMKPVGGEEQAPPYDIELFCHDKGVAINGIIYFLLVSDDIRRTITLPGKTLWARLILRRKSGDQ